MKLSLYLHAVQHSVLAVCPFGLDTPNQLLYHKAKLVHDHLCKYRDDHVLTYILEICQTVQVFPQLHQTLVKMNHR